MNNRRAKLRAILRMQRHPVPYSAFVPIRRYGGHGGRTKVFAMEIGRWEEFRFITSPALDVLRE